MYGVATISRLLKIIGLFCKVTYKRDDTLQKRLIILMSLLIVATPYQCLFTRMSQRSRLTSCKSQGQEERWGAGVETQKMYGERLGDGVEYHLMKPTPRRSVPFTTGRRAH